MTEIERILKEAGAVASWQPGYPLHESRRDAIFYRAAGSNFVGQVKISDFAVDIYCDGEVRIHDRTTDSTFFYGSDVIGAGYDTDEKLSDATESGDLYVVHNSWFDLYCEGEHLDAVTHDIWDALNAAIAFLKEEKANAEEIENLV